MSLRIDVLTLFPEMFAGPFDVSIVRRARDAGLIDLRLHQLRDYATGRHAVVDDYPYGGGPGMLLKPEPIFRAVEAVRAPGAQIGALAASAPPFTQHLAGEWAQVPQIILLCGRSEGNNG